MAQPAQNERNWKRIGANVRQRRKQAGMSQEDLGFATGLSPKTIGRMERGEGGQQTDTLIDIARALSVWSGELLRGVR